MTGNSVNHPDGKNIGEKGHTAKGDKVKDNRGIEPKMGSMTLATH